MDIDMIVRERDCIAEIKCAVHGHYYENDDDYEYEYADKLGHKSERGTRDRANIAEDAQITAQHESGRESSTARASNTCSTAT